MPENYYINGYGDKIVLKTTKSNAKLQYRHECLYCGQTFLSNRKTAKYCGDYCRIMNFRYKQRASKQERERIRIEELRIRIHEKIRRGESGDS